MRRSTDGSSPPHFGLPVAATPPPVHLHLHRNSTVDLQADLDSWCRRAPQRPTAERLATTTSVTPSIFVASIPFRGTQRGLHRIMNANPVTRRSSPVIAQNAMLPVPPSIFQTPLMSSWLIKLFHKEYDKMSYDLMDIWRRPASTGIELQTHPNF
jgi:hypothetical protein